MADADSRSRHIAALTAAWNWHPELTLGELVDSAARLAGAYDAWDAPQDLTEALTDLIYVQPISRRLADPTSDDAEKTHAALDLADIGLIAAQTETAS